MSRLSVNIYSYTTVYTVNKLMSLTEHFNQTVYTMSEARHIESNQLPCYLPSAAAKLRIWFYTTYFDINMFHNDRKFICAQLVCCRMASSFIWRWWVIAITINRRECHTYYFVCSVAKSVQRESLTNNLFFTSAVLQFVISTSFPIATTNTVLSNTSACFLVLVLHIRKWKLCGDRTE